MMYHLIIFENSIFLCSIISLTNIKTSVFKFGHNLVALLRTKVRLESYSILSEVASFAKCIAFKKMFAAYGFVFFR